MWNEDVTGPLGSARFQAFQKQKRKKGEPNIIYILQVNLQRNETAHQPMRQRVGETSMPEPSNAIWLNQVHVKPQS